MSNEIEIERKKNGQTTVWVGGDTFSGISIDIRKGSRTLYISGYYDGGCGIEGAEMKLDDLIKLFEAAPTPTPDKEQKETA